MPVAQERKTAAASNGAAPEDPPKTPDVPQIEAARGEVVDDGPQTKVLIWHGVNLVLPSELGAAFMFDVMEAQIGDDTALLRAIYETVGKEQWAKARRVAAEERLPAEDFHKLVQEVMAQYGMGPGEASGSGDSSEKGSDS